MNFLNLKIYNIKKKIDELEELEEDDDNFKDCNDYNE